MALVESPKLTRHLPDSLSESQVDRLLSEPNVEDAVECRDKASARAVVCDRFEGERARWLDDGADEPAPRLSAHCG